MIEGVISIVILLALIFYGVPIGFALMATGLLGMGYLAGWKVLVSSVPQDMFNFINSYQLGVLVMFMFMGQIGYYSGIMDSVFEAARRWLGRLRGGLALSVVVAGTAYAACSGSSVASCLIIGKSAVPLMRKAGYPETLATGVVAASGCLASIIPPSALICVYGLLVGESIGRLLIGAVLPGLFTAILYAVTVRLMSRHVQIDREMFTWGQKFYAFRYLWIVVLMILAIMGAMYLGVATATEGGAIGAFVTMLLAIGSRKFGWKIFSDSVTSTIISCSMVFIILVGALFYSRTLVLSGFSAGITNYIATIHAPREVIFLLISVIWLLLGCLVDAVSMLVITLPIFYPIVLGLGYDPIWFGIIAVVYCEIAVITPPVAVNLFAMKNVAPDIPMGSIMRGVIPFIVAQLAVVVILYIFPWIVTFLPSKMSM